VRYLGASSITGADGSPSAPGQVLTATAATLGGYSWALPSVRGRAAITTDSSGIATITHSAGFIPSVAFVLPELAGAPVLVGLYNRVAWTTNTIQIKAWVPNTAAVYVGNLSAVHFMVLP